MVDWGAHDPLPGVTAEEQTAAYWKGKLGKSNQVVLTASGIATLNRSLTRDLGGWPLGQSNLLDPMDPTALRSTVQERIKYAQNLIRSGVLVDRKGSRPKPVSWKRTEPLSQTWLRVKSDLPIHCYPTTIGLYKKNLDLRFDRNLCSTARKGEVVQLLQKGPKGFALVRTPYVIGWIQGHEKRVVALSKEAALARIRREPKNLTRSAWIDELFRRHGQAYGWGGTNGGVDCSRFVMDALGAFGLGMPRNSARQSMATTGHADVADWSTKQKTQLLNDVQHNAIVLLHLPGHIMVYLGRGHGGKHRVIHAFSEFSEARGDATTVRHQVHRVAVTGLHLGKNTKKGSFIERVDRISVLTRRLPRRARNLFKLRPGVDATEIPDQCQDSQSFAAFHMPRRPHRGQALRVLVTANTDRVPLTLTAFGPSGVPLRSKSFSTTGPPRTLWMNIPKPAPGPWHVTLGDGPDIFACERIAVSRFVPKVREVKDIPHVEQFWTPTWTWEQDTEDLYSAFVEQLFAVPDERTTWPNLHTLLRDPARNLLHNYLSENEDDELTLEPDCADLPYYLRAYFAWKVGLPFAYRRCGRGRPGQPPVCGLVQYNVEPQDPLANSPEGENRKAMDGGADSEREPETQKTNAERFATFAKRLRSAIHSATARTHPKDDGTDLYPVALRRDQLTPGTVFADPDGHLLVVAKWKPQPAGGYGVLLGADAQPDGTVGRRRFGRGTFVFRPDVTDAGAGFKAWRPVHFDAATLTMVQPANHKLKSSKVFAPYSLEQYQLSVDSFYERMDELISPRPLSAATVARATVENFLVAVQRRGVSIKVGIEHMEKTRWERIQMPEGYAIFETKGPWEDFATPARDMRLLMSMDEVTALPDRVKKNPRRYGVEKDRAPEMAKQLWVRMEKMMKAHELRYARSDGSVHTLTLLDILHRRDRLEMAYNPNDCVEVRWGAKPGTGEHAPCAHRAPEAQHKRMLAYRSWFKARRRPPRPAPR